MIEAELQFDIKQEQLNRELERVTSVNSEHHGKTYLNLSSRNSN